MKIIICIVDKNDMISNGYGKNLIYLALKESLYMEKFKICINIKLLYRFP